MKNVIAVLAIALSTTVSASDLVSSGDMTFTAEVPIIRGIKIVDGQGELHLGGKYMGAGDTEFEVFSNVPGDKVVVSTDVETENLGTHTVRMRVPTISYDYGMGSKMKLPNGTYKAAAYTSAYAYELDGGTEAKAVITLTIE